MKRSLFNALSAGILTIVSAGLANATITVTTPTITGTGPYTWTYGITGDTAEQVVAGNYATCMGGTACGTFFTIYDFQGYVAGSIFAPTGWTGTTMATGLTPSGQLVTDSSVVNLVFTYNGATIPVPTLSGFGAQTSFNTINNGGTFSYEAQKISNPSAPDQGQGPLNVPQSSVPEPISMTMLGGGLAVLGLLRFRRK